MPPRSIFLGLIVAVGAIMSVAALSGAHPEALSGGAGPALTLRPFVVSASPTQTPPSATRLLALSVARSRSLGSVQEIGAIISSDDSVLDTRHFSANFSWFKHIYKDIELFRTPIALFADIGKVKHVRRLVVGQLVSAFAGGKWFCRKASIAANAAYWDVPTYKLTNPTISGSTVVNGQPMWILKGRFIAYRKGSRSDLMVKLLIDKKRDLIRLADESGTVHLLGRPAHIDGRLKYTQYGAPVSVKLPSVCRG
jgi:hypothetical protein